MKRILELRHNAVLQITLLIVGLIIGVAAICAGPYPVDEVLKEAIKI